MTAVGFAILRRMAYELTIHERPGYLHARATGDRTPQNVLHFLEQAYAACVKGSHSALLVEMDFTGPTLGSPKIFQLVCERSDDARHLRRIAYVDDQPGDPAGPWFAETVARNRGVNVRLFSDLASAEAWLQEKP